MGEGRFSGGESRVNRRLTVPEAAAAIGITEAAVRGRIKRGTLRSYREEGAVFVVLEGDEAPPNRDASSDEPSDQVQLIAVLREQLAAEREANRENRRIIAGLVQRIPELEATLEPRDEPETPRQDAGGVGDRGETAEPQTGAQEQSPIGERSVEEEARRPWWLRWLGG